MTGMKSPFPSVDWQLPRFSYEYVVTVAVGGAGATNAAVAGSATVTVINEKTNAYIGDGAKINSANTYSAGFDAKSNVNAVSDSITFGTAHDFITGDAVVYHKNGDAQEIGLTDGATYYVIVNSPNQIKLADTYLDAIDRTGIQDLTTGSATANHSFTFLIGTDQNVQVLASDDTDYYAGAGAAGIALGTGAGIGVAADSSILIKETKAYIGKNASIFAQGNVKVHAASSENVVAAALSIAYTTTGAGVAGMAIVHIYTIDTKAYIGELAVVYAEGSVVVSADDRTGVNLIGGSAALAINPEGSVAVGASADVIVITKHVLSYIDTGATIDALGNRDAVEIYSGDFDINFYSDNDDPLEVHSPDVTNSDADVYSIIRWRVSTPLTTTVKGVAVTAINRDDLEMIAVSGSIGTDVGVALSGAVLTLVVDTEAYINDNSQVNVADVSENSAQSIYVAAGSDVYHFGVAGALAGGAGAFGPGVHVAVIDLTTLAYIGDNTQIEAEEDITVLANALEDILSISVSAAGGGIVVAGAVSVVPINSQTWAYIGTSANVTADGNILVSSSDVTKTIIIAGSLTYGSGVGASVVVTTIYKDTQAFLGASAVVNARGNSAGTLSVYSGDPDSSGDYQNNDGDYLKESIVGLGIQAFSTEDLLSIAASGNISMNATIAGAVTVELIDSDTIASIGNLAQINQDQTGSNASQSVNVSAVNYAEALTIAGVLVLGGSTANVGGGVDVGILQNDVAAVIGNGAGVSANQDIETNALADKDVMSFAISIAAGSGVGISGAVSVWTIGGNLSSDALSYLQIQDQSSTNDPANSSIANFADSSELLNLLLDMLTSYGDETSSPEAFNASTGVNSTDNSITFSTTHGFNNGDALVYDQNSGSDIGLTDDHIYYVIVINDYTIQLAETRQEALSYQSEGIDLTSSASSQTQYVVLFTEKTLAETTDDAADELVQSTTAATFDPVADVSGTDITVSDVSQFETGDAVVYTTSGGDPIGGLADGRTYYIVGIDTVNKTIKLSATAGGSAISLTPLVVSQATLHGFKNGVSQAIVSATIVPAGTSAMIGSSTEIYAGRNVEVVAVDESDLLAVTGSAGIGQASFGAAVTYVDIDEDVSASLGGDVRAGLADSTGDIIDSIVVTSQLTENVRGWAFAGTLSSTVGASAQVVIIKDSSDVTAYIADYAKLDKADQVIISANSNQKFQVLSIGGSIGYLGAAGASVAYVTVEGSTQAALGDYVEVGQTSGMTVIDLVVKVLGKLSGTSKAIAVAAGIYGAGAGSDAKNRFQEKI